MEDDHKFQGFGVCGLAYALDKRPEDFVILDPAKPVMKDRRVLVVPADGDTRLAWADE
jgi:hypothetical protein